MTAMAVPLIEEKIDGWRGWMDDCLGPRREEFDAFNERMGLTMHRVWLAEGPHGPMAVVIFEGSGAKTFLQKLGTSKEPFDKWFRERIEELHGCDFSELAKMKPSELVMDWKAPSYAEVGE
jgi:hypothetical protein